jgi:hypothetical protein
MPIMMEVVYTREKSPLNEIKKAKLFQPFGRISSTNPRVVEQLPAKSTA